MSLDMRDITILITAVTALVAVIVGPIISVYVTRRQIRASVVSINRQVWINTLRDAIAEWLTVEQVIIIAPLVGFWDKEAVGKALEKIILLDHHIRLLINPTDDDHAKLIELLKEERIYIEESLRVTREAHDNNKVSAANKIVSLAQLILKREWEVVKRGD